MSDSLTTEIRASVSWLFQETLDLSTISDSSRLDYTQTISDGVSDGQADKL